MKIHIHRLRHSDVIQALHRALIYDKIFVRTSNACKLIHALHSSLGHAAPPDAAVNTFRTAHADNGPCKDAEDK